MRLEIDACHCSICRRRSGDVFRAAACGDELTFQSASTPGGYRSSEYEERLFCRDCRSSLIWRLQSGSSPAVALKAFDDLSGFVSMEEIFVEEKPDQYNFANETRKRTGAEVMAQFANEQGA